MPRSNGGRGLNSVLDMFKNRMANLSNYLQQTHNKPRMEIVKHRERGNIIRIGNIIRNQYSAGEDDSNEIIKNNIRKEHYNSWTENVTHGFLQKKLTEDTSVDNKATNQWLKSNMSSHVEGYILALQEQEINIRDSLKRKEKNLKKKQEMNSTCRLCRKNVETLYHVTTGCPAVSSSLYLNIRHNAIAKIIFKNIINENENTMQKIFKDPEPITVFRDLEI